MAFLQIQTEIFVINMPYLTGILKNQFFQLCMKCEFTFKIEYS